MIAAGLIGYGYWGPNLARCLAEQERCVLAAVHDSNSDARRRAALRHPGARIDDDVRELINDPLVDAVLVATPVHTHHRLALAALQAGKHVLVEKPLAASAAEAATLVAEAERRRRVLMVDHTFVYTPAVRKIHELVTTGRIGEVQYYDSVRVNLGLFQSDVNVVWDLAVHDLAILSYLLGESPVSISAQAARHLPSRPESMAFVTLAYASGAVAHINVNWLAPVKVRQTLIGGSRQMIVYNDLEPSEKVKVYDKGAHLVGDREQRDQLRVGYRTGDMWAPQLAATEALRTGIEHFLDCIEADGTPITDGRVGLGIVELLETATHSIRQGGRPIDLRPARLAS
jgi:predicted dehydrogenase